MGITVIGTVFVDIKGYPYEKYIPDGRNSGYMLQVHGGVGRNIAEDLANLGYDVCFVSLTDESGLAIEVIDRLKKSRVDTRFVASCPLGMGKWMAIFDEKGDVAGNISIRPDLHAISDIIEKNQKEIFENTDSILLEIDIEPDSLDSIFKYAKKYKKKVYSCVSVMSIALERMDYIKRSDCFVCNLQEAGMLFNESFEDCTKEEIISRAAAKLPELGIKSIIITMSERGSVYIDSNNSAVCEAEPAELVDSTGAGDAFFAGAAAALTYGKNIKEALRLGTVAASSVISVKENVCPRQ